MHTPHLHSPAAIAAANDLARLVRRGHRYTGAGRATYEGRLRRALARWLARARGL